MRCKKNKVSVSTSAQLNIVHPKNKNIHSVENSEVYNLAIGIYLGLEKLGLMLKLFGDCDKFCCGFLTIFSLRPLKCSFSSFVVLDKSYFFNPPKEMVAVIFY
jgi:hypothetical protein